MSEKYLSSRKVPQPRSDISGRSLSGTMPISKSPESYLGQTAGADTGSHMSDPIRAELGKLTASLAAGVRRVAGSK
jgi:hypothetical protein